MLFQMAHLVCAIFYYLMRNRMSIQNLRDKSDGVIAKVIVGLIIVVFALFGMGSITTFVTPVA